MATQPILLCTKEMQDYQSKRRQDPSSGLYPDTLQVRRASMLCLLCAACGTATRWQL